MPQSLTRVNLAAFKYLAGSTGLLLVAAVSALPRPETRKYLGDLAGLSQFAAGRAAQTLEDEGLLTSDGEGNRLMFSSRHPASEEIVRIVHLSTGVSAETRMPIDETSMTEGGIPESLKLPKILGGHLIPGLGPLQAICDPTTKLSGIASRAQADRVGRIVLIAKNMTMAVDNANAHTLSGLSRAWPGFAEAAVSALEGYADTDAAVTGWVRAIYRLAELHKPVAEVVDWLKTSADSGERLFAAQSEILLAAVEETLTTMTANPVFHVWCAAYPDEAASHPLPAAIVRLQGRPKPNG